MKGSLLKGFTNHSSLQKRPTGTESSSQVRGERMCGHTNMHIFGTQGHRQPGPASQRPWAEGGSLAVSDLLELVTDGCEPITVGSGD